MIKMITKHKKIMKIQKLLNLDENICSECGGYCCLEGNIKLNQNDIKRIIDFLNINEENFIKTYTHYNKKFQYFELIQPCSFFIDKKCSIYDVRPEVCEEYPIRIDGYLNVFPCCQGRLIQKILNIPNDNWFKDEKQKILKEYKKSNKQYTKFLLEATEFNDMMNVLININLKKLLKFLKAKSSDLK